MRDVSVGDIVYFVACGEVCRVLDVLEPTAVDPRETFVLKPVSGGDLYYGFRSELREQTLDDRPGL